MGEARKNAPIMASANPYQRSWRALRVARRPPSHEPRAMPPIHTATAADAAQMVLPSTSPSIRIHTTSPIKAVSPERKKSTTINHAMHNPPIRRAASYRVPNTCRLCANARDAKSTTRPTPLTTAAGMRAGGR